MEVTAIWQLFSKGGLVMYPLLACSMTVVAIGVERWFYYRRHYSGAGPLLSGLLPALQQRDFAQALQFCRAARGDVAAIMAEAIEGHITDVATLRLFFETEAAIAASRLRERLGVLEAVVTVAPLLGLLGTVVGMIESFQVMAVQAGQVQAITGGVGEALIATGTGLVVAILAFLFHSYFTGVLNQAIADMELVFGRTLTILRRSEKNGIAKSADRASA